MTRWLLAAVHLLGMGIGLGAVWARARALAGPLDGPGLRRVFAADSWWGVSAVLLVVTGAVRAFSGFEKGADYYMGNSIFLTKMALLAAVILLELMPMLGLIRWRVAARNERNVDVSPAGRYAAISYVQAVLVVLMVLAAAAMARGVGAS
jgi:putative membrane protein